jgi:hypothetical protein
MTPLRFFPAVALLLAAIAPASAADAVFPPGVRVGIAPLVGLAPAKTFAGFETEDQSVKVLIAELPAGAYGEVSNALKANPAIANGANPRPSRRRPARPTTPRTPPRTAAIRCGNIR